MGIKRGGTVNKSDDVTVCRPRR